MAERPARGVAHARRAPRPLPGDELASFLLIKSLDTWQLIINTITSIVTFWLVALLQNSQRRSERALHVKLNAIADGLADLMEHLAEETPGTFTAIQRSSARARGSRNASEARGAQTKPSSGLEPLTPSLPWKCSTN